MLSFSERLIVKAKIIGDKYFRIPKGIDISDSIYQTCYFNYVREVISDTMHPVDADELCYLVRRRKYRRMRLDEVDNLRIDPVPVIDMLTETYPRSPFITALVLPYFMGFGDVFGVSDGSKLESLLAGRPDFDRRFHEMLNVFGLRPDDYYDCNEDLTLVLDIIKHYKEHKVIPTVTFDSSRNVYVVA